MGLDLLEFYLAVEEEFEIRLPWDHGGPNTVGGLHQLICREIEIDQFRKPDVCTSFRPFFAVRNAIVEAALIPRSRVRPTAKFASLILVGQRRGTWLHLQTETHLRLPGLTLSQPTSIGLQIAVAALVAIFMVASVKLFGSEGVWLGILAALFLSLATYGLSRRWAVEFPATCQTVGDVVRLARRRSAAGSHSAESEAIWQTLVAIVSDQLDVPVSEITPNARFVEDLKCG